MIYSGKISNFRHYSLTMNCLVYYFTERDLLEYLAGLEIYQEGNDTEQSDQEESDKEQSNDLLSDDESEEEEITHAVPFKCIGAAHEKSYQHHLEQAYLLLNRTYQ